MGKLTCALVWRTPTVKIPASEMAMLNQRLSSFIQYYTLNGLVRPFGASVILGVYDKNGPSLYMVEPSESVNKKD